MTNDEYWDARSEYREDAYNDALQKERENYEDYIEGEGLSEDEYSFDDWLNEPVYDDLAYYGWVN